MPECRERQHVAGKIDIDKILALARNDPAFREEIKQRLVAPLLYEEQIATSVERFLAGEEEVETADGASLCSGYSGQEAPSAESADTAGSAAESAAESSPPSEAEESAQPLRPAEAAEQLAAKQERARQQQREQKEVLAERKKLTLVLTKFPRDATEQSIGHAFDRVLGSATCITRGRIVRDGLTGESTCYGFFEFQDEQLVAEALEACRRSRVVIDDLAGHAWHLKASPSRRATVGVAGAGGGDGRRRRGGRRAAPVPIDDPALGFRHPVGGRPPPMF